MSVAEDPRFDFCVVFRRKAWLNEPSHDPSARWYASVSLSSLNDLLDASATDARLHFEARLKHLEPSLTADDLGKLFKAGMDEAAFNAYDTKEELVRELVDPKMVGIPLGSARKLAAAHFAKRGAYFSSLPPPLAPH